MNYPFKITNTRIVGRSCGLCPRRRKTLIILQAGLFGPKLKYINSHASTCANKNSQTGHTYICRDLAGSCRAGLGGQGGKKENEDALQEKYMSLLTTVALTPLPGFAL